MRDLLDQVNQRYEELKKTIQSQKSMIEELKAEKGRLEQDKAEQKGRIIELEAKWSKIQNVLKGVNI